MTSMVDVDNVYVSLGYPKGREHDDMLAMLHATTEIAANSAGVIALLNVLWDVHYCMCQPDDESGEKVVMAADFFHWIKQYDEGHSLIRLEKVLEKSVMCSGQRPYIDGENCFDMSMERHYAVCLSDGAVVAYVKAILTWYPMVDDSERILYSDVKFSSIMY